MRGALEGWHRARAPLGQESLEEGPRTRAAESLSETTPGEPVLSVPVHGPAVVRRRIPTDVARVLDVYAELGRAARRGLYVSERVAAWQVQQAAAHAAILSRSLRPAARTSRRTPPGPP